QPREKLVLRPTRCEPMRCRERLAVPFHLIGAEQFRSERQLFGRELERRTAEAQTGLELGQMPENRGAACHQLDQSPSNSAIGCNCSTCCETTLTITMIGMLSNIPAHCSRARGARAHFDFADRFGTSGGLGKATSKS